MSVAKIPPQRRGYHKAGSWWWVGGSRRPFLEPPQTATTSCTKQHNQLENRFFRWWILRTWALRCDMVFDGNCGRKGTTFLRCGFGTWRRRWRLNADVRDDGDLLRRHGIIDSNPGIMGVCGGGTWRGWWLGCQDGGKKVIL